MRNKLQLTSIWPAVMWAFFILGLSIIPVSGKAPFIKIPHFDKFVHLVFYAILCGLIMLQTRILNTKNLKIVGAFLTSFVWGLFIEIIQGLFFKGRFFEWTDVMANMSGSIIALIVLNKRIII